MSLVYITFHGENINDIEKQISADKHYKFPKYVSIHRKAVRDPPINQIDKEGKKAISASKKYSHKTLGYAETPLDDPSNYLKKNGGIRWNRINEHVCPPHKDLPPIPKYEPSRNECSKNVNFIARNIKRIQTAAPHRTPCKYVDTVVGEQHALDGTGLIPEHVFSKKYGKSPAYLNSIRKRLKLSKCYQDSEKHRTSYGITELGTSERNAILMGLRENYAQLEKTYQLLPIFTDTNSKKQRKTKLEKELKRLEQDILLLESNPLILVSEY